MITNQHAAALQDFIDESKDVRVEDKMAEFNDIFKVVKRYKTLDAKTKILEVGTGTGWLVIQCERLGMKCKGIEVSADLVDCARRLGQNYGVHPDIEIAKIEEANLGTNEYDVIIASSTFEHVANWREGLRKVFHALKPGGVFFFYSTNKFSFKSGEYDFPFYGWLPDRWRYRLRSARQGNIIMQWGIDFNQFTYFQLRRFFGQLGYATVLDRIDILDADHLNHPTWQRKLILGALKRLQLLKHGFLFFSNGTLFVCIK
jgi:2-polyprenyl-3-methyl-5-hydroxy-6-metoxy-1,4-benzoquinol methylase